MKHLQLLILFIFLFSVVSHAQGRNRPSKASDAAKTCPEAPKKKKRERNSDTVVLGSERFARNLAGALGADPRATSSLRSQDVWALADEEENAARGARILAAAAAAEQAAAARAAQAEAEALPAPIPVEEFKAAIDEIWGVFIAMNAPGRENCALASRSGAFY